MPDDYFPGFAIPRGRGNLGRGDGLDDAGRLRRSRTGSCCGIAGDSGRGIGLAYDLGEGSRPAPLRWAIGPRGPGRAIRRWRPENDAGQCESHALPARRTACAAWAAAAGGAGTMPASARGLDRCRPRATRRRSCAPNRPWRAPSSRAVASRAVAEKLHLSWIEPVAPRMSWPPSSRVPCQGGRWLVTVRGVSGGRRTQRSSQIEDLFRKAGHHGLGDCAFRRQASPNRIAVPRDSRSNWSGTSGLRRQGNPGATRPPRIVAGSGPRRERPETARPAAGAPAVDPGLRRWRITGQTGPGFP